MVTPPLLTFSPLYTCMLKLSSLRGALQPNFQAQATKLHVLATLGKTASSTKEPRLPPFDLHRYVISLHLEALNAVHAWVRVWVRVVGVGAISVCCARYVVPTGVPSWRGAHQV